MKSRSEALAEKKLPVWERGANAEQLEVIRHETGPCRVLAAAGSGKTFAVTRRIVRLVSLKIVEAERICAMTFSKKAADEMNKRVRQLGVNDARVGTWHSLCLQILRQDNTKWAFWSIDGENDKPQKARYILKDVLGHRGMDWKGHDLTKVASFIGRCKANLWEPSSSEALEAATPVFSYNASKAVQAFQRYNDALEEKEILTFDDFLVFACQHLQSSDEIRRTWSSKWDQLLCDEVQDNNIAQSTLSHLLAGEHRNYMAVGDCFQCIPEGQMISTPEGQKPVEDIEKGDDVLAIKAGKLVTRRVVRKSTTTKQSAFEFDLGEHGCFRATKEHVLFASIDDPRGSYVYLMYREDHGFRIGVTRTVGHRGDHFIVRTQQEGGERLWVLGWFESYAEAAEQEAFWAYQYGIPREPFTPRAGMWSGSVDATKRLFDRFGHNGWKLLSELHLDFDRPNYFAKASHRGRVAINILMATKDGHRVEVETSVIDPKKCRSLGMKSTGKGTFRTRRCFSELRDARIEAERLARALGGYIVEALAKVGGGRKTLGVPAASVHVGMRIPVIDENGTLVSARVLARRVVKAGRCFDFEVQGLANFIVNGAVVHNSIFEFRGASPEYLANFDKEWSEARTILLPRNYRSGKTIIDTANAIVRHAKIEGLEPTDMIGERDSDGRVRVLCAEAHDDEANEVVGEIASSVASNETILSDHTILYRTNAQSRAVEEALLKKRIPYIVVGGVSFYERREVRDLLAYLRLAAGRAKAEDVKRSINTPFRFLGAKFVDRVMSAVADVENVDWVSTVHDVAQQEGLQQRQRVSAFDWARMIGDMQQTILLGAAASASDVDAKNLAKPSVLLESIIRATRYIEWLQKEEGDESTENSGAANVREMVRVAERFSSVDEVLDYIDETIRAAKRQREDKQAGGQRVLLMSIHRSKGLEWPRVYVIGMNEMVLPHARGNVEEERRLAYVAVTRARDVLTLSYVRRIATRAGVKDVEASRFIRDTGLSTNVSENAVFGGKGVLPGSKDSTP